MLSIKICGYKHNQYKHIKILSEDKAVVQNHLHNVEHKMTGPTYDCVAVNPRLWLAGLNIGWDCLVPHCIMGSRDQWEFPPFFSAPATVPLRSPNGKQMPAVSAVQRELWKSLSPTAYQIAQNNST